MTLYSFVTLRHVNRNSSIIISQLRSVTCHMGSHIVTCHPTQVNTPCLNLSQTDRYSIYLSIENSMRPWNLCLQATAKRRGRRAQEQSVWRPVATSNAKLLNDDYILSKLTWLLTAFQSLRLHQGNICVLLPVISWLCRHID